jgi:mannose-6-phosphate isomerase-like protein (cupin superfamily)
MSIRAQFKDRTHVPILKPWGWEVEIWNSIHLSIIYLNIDGGKSTSLHCHPNKRTGYIVLRGEVEIEFLAGTKRYKAGERVNFRPSLFHRSRAITREVVLLELESPPDKNDLVRLEDSNNRSDSVYEKKTVAIDDLNQSILQSVYRSLYDSTRAHKKIDSLACSMSIESTTPKEMLVEYDDHVIVSTVNGTIHTERRLNGSRYEAIVQPGDVTTIRDLRRMSKVLDMNSPISFFLVKFGAENMKEHTR